MSRPPRCWPVTRRPRPPSTTRAAWPPAGQAAGGGRGRAGRHAGRPGRRRRPPRRPGPRGQPAGRPAEDGRGRAGRHAGPRAAADAPLDDPGRVGSLLAALQKADADEQAATLAAGYRRLHVRALPRARTATRISSVSDGRPTAPRPRHGAGTTWTYSLFPGHGDRRYQRNILPVRPTADRRIRKLSLDSSRPGRPELHCETQLSAPLLAIFSWTGQRSTGQQSLGPPLSGGRILPGLPRFRRPPPGMRVPVDPELATDDTRLYQFPRPAPARRRGIRTQADGDARGCRDAPPAQVL